MKLGSIALPIVAALLVLPSSSEAQQRRDTVELQIGALRYARMKVAKGRIIAIDTTSVIDFARGRAAHVFNDAVVSALGAVKRGPGSELIVCASLTDDRTCRMRGVDVVLTLSFPRIAGDTAYVPIRFQERQDARWPVSEARERVRFVRRGGAWVFLSAFRNSQT